MRVFFFMGFVVEFVSLLLWTVNKIAVNNIAKCEKGCHRLLKWPKMHKIDKSDREVNKIGANIIFFLGILVVML